MIGLGRLRAVPARLLPLILEILRILKLRTLLRILPGRTTLSLSALPLFAGLIELLLSGLILPGLRSLIVRRLPA